MRVLSLFSGVGMFDYAFRKLGWETVAFAEQDKWCQRVLNKHWPDVPVYDDVRDITYDRLKEDGIISDTNSVKQRPRQGYKQPKGSPSRQRISNDSYPRRQTETPNQPAGVDVLCGGFPCQDLSVAGKQAGIDAERSGLWSEFARIIGELRPGYVLIENVPALLTGDNGAWMRRVLGDLAEIGFDAEWHVIPAGDSQGRLSAGAPHKRDRVWIVAYPKHNGQHDLCIKEDGAGNSRWSETTIKQSAGASEDVTDSNSTGLQGSATRRKVQGRQTATGHTGQGSSTYGRGEGQSQPNMGLLAHGIAAGLSRSRWLPEPGIGRVATGVPDRVNKLKALGNGLVWQIPYAIGKSIMEQTS